MTVRLVSSVREDSNFVLSFQGFPSSIEIASQSASNTAGKFPLLNAASPLRRIGPKPERFAPARRFSAYNRLTASSRASNSDRKGICWAGALSGQKTSKETRATDAVLFIGRKLTAIPFSLTHHVPSMASISREDQCASMASGNRVEALQGAETVKTVPEELLCPAPV